MSGLKLLRSALVAGLALASVLPASAGELKVVAFAGASNWPFWIGQEKGFFKKYAVEPTLDITPNSVEMAKNLFGGRYDMALTAIDNIIAYDEGQGEAGLPENAGFVALFGIDDGMLSIMAKNDIATLKDLKGKTFSVDAMTTGFAFVQRELLKRSGMSDADVKWVKVGGGAQRLEALIKGEQDATLLNTPLDLAAEAKGFRRLIRAKDELGAYQGIVGAVKRDNAPAKRAEIVGFIRGFRELGRVAGRSRQQGRGDRHFPAPHEGHGTPGRREILHGADGREGRHLSRPEDQPGGREDRHDAALHLR